MDHARVVRRLHAGGDLDEDVEGFVERERPARDAIGEGLSFDQLEGEVAAAAGFLEAVDRGDVRMVQRGQHPRLTLESLQAIRVRGNILGQSLERDGAAEAGVVGEENHAHAPAPDFAVYLIGANGGAGLDGHKGRRVSFPRHSDMCRSRILNQPPEQGGPAGVGMNRSHTSGRKDDTP